MSPVRRRRLRNADSREVLRRRRAGLAWAFIAGVAILALPLARSSGQEAAAKKPAASGVESPGSAAGGLDLLVVNRTTGRPEPGVVIESPLASGLTDARGRYRISWTGARPARLWFNVRKAGFVHLQVHWDNAGRPGAVAIPRDYTVELDPGSEIGGIVRDEDGQPIAGASVVVTGGTSDPPRAGGPRIHAIVNHQTKTDAQGRWKCGEVPDRANLSLTITHPDYVVERNPIRVTVNQPDVFDKLRTREHVGVLRRGSTIEGQVRGADGPPLAGAEISVSGMFGMRGPAWKADAAGRFRLEHVAPGPNDLLIRAPGHRPTTRPVIAGPDTKPIEIVLERGRSVSGRVVDHTGKPVSEAKIRFELGDRDADRAAPTVTADVGGRFRLDGVPDDPGSLVAARQGTSSRVTRPLSPTENDVKVVLPTFDAIVRGTVTDAETGRPVPSFALVMDGCHMGRIAGADGIFRMEWVNWTWCKELRIAIDAEGYAFSTWRTVPDPAGRPEVTMDFRLKKAAPVVCVVHAPDGSPLPDAEVGVGSPSADSGFRLQFRIFDVRLRPNTNTYAPLWSNGRGEFTLAPFEESYPVVVAHERGYAIRDTGKLRDDRASPVEIRLEPWGRVEGTLRVGNRPGGGERITLYWSEPAGMPRRFVNQSPSTTTDDQGRFAFDRLLPGTWRVSTRMSQPIPAFRVEPGQAAKLVLGGTGRPVVGRLALPDGVKAIARRRVGGRLSSRVETAGDPEIRTAEGRRRRQEEQSNLSRYFYFTPQPDGTFRMEDVPPGDYEIGAWCHEEIGEGQGYESHTVGKLQRTIRVPEIPGGKDSSEEPFDIGALTLEPYLGVGQPAPEFRVTGLDGKPIRLSDFKGKHVLVVFWAPDQQRGGLEESRALRSLNKYRSFTSGEKLIILGICTETSSPEAARAILTQRGWDWLNAVEDIPRGDEPRAEPADSLRVRYNLPFRPSVWLIGPDGRILGRDLRGEAIRAAAAKVLRAR